MAVVRSYWKQVVARACSDTIHVFEPDRRRWVLVPALFVIGSCVHWWRTGFVSMMGEISVAVSYGVYAVGIAAVLFFFWNLIAAPACIYHEQSETIAGLEKEILEERQLPPSLSDALTVEFIAFPGLETIWANGTEHSAMFVEAVRITNKARSSVNIDATMILNALHRPDELLRLPSYTMRQLSNLTFGQPSPLETKHEHHILTFPHNMQSCTTIRGDMLFIFPKRIDRRSRTQGIDLSDVQIEFKDFISSTVMTVVVRPTKHE